MNLSALWVGLRALGFSRTPSVLWADRGSGSNVGDRIFVTDIGNSGGTLFYWTGTRWNPVGGVLTWSNATDSSVTGTTSETVLGTVSFPAGLIPANATIEATALWNYTNSANTKTALIRLGGLAGTAYMTQTATTTANIQQRSVIRCTTTSSQKAQTAAVPAFTNAQSSTANITSTIDMTAATTLVFNGTLTNTGETITVRGYTVQVFFP